MATTRDQVPSCASWNRLPVIVIEPPYLRGLVLLRHRLAAAQTAENLRRVAEVHLASARLPQPPGEGRQGGLDRRNPQRVNISEGPSTASQSRRLSWL